MRFAEPWAFLAAILIPLAWLLQLGIDRRRRARLEASGDIELLESMSSVAPHTLSSFRWVQLVLFSLAFCLVTVALARPQFGTRTEVRKGRGMDLVVALDLSRSMYAQDVVPSRLQRARVEISDLIDGLPGDRIGLVGFTSVAVPLCPITVDRATVKLQLDSADPKDMPRGGTAISDAILESKKMLEASKSTAEKAIVVITDGEEHEGEPEKVADEAKKAGISVHVVGVGSRTGEPIPLMDEQGRPKGYLKDARGQTVISRLDESRLEAIATAGGGVVALPGEAGGLDLSPVRAHLSRMKKAELESRTVRVYEERYRWALLPAFLFLLLATAWRPRRTRARIRVRGGAGLIALSLCLPLLIGAGPFSSEDKDVRRGNEALAAGKAAEAIEAYEKAKTRLGGDPRLAFNRGLAEAAAGELGAAVEQFQSAAAAAKDPALRAQAAFALGNAQRKLKKYDEALSAYRQAMLEDPSHTGARRNFELTQAMRRIAKLNPNQDQKNDDQKDDSNKDESPDAGTEDSGAPDAGPPEAGPEDGGGPDGGGPDGGTGDGGGSDSGQDQGRDGGTEDGGGQSSAEPDAGAGSDGGDAGAEPQPSPQDQAPEQDLEAQDVEQLLDSLQEQEKALQRQRLLKKVQPKQVEKDW